MPVADSAQDLADPDLPRQVTRLLAPRWPFYDDRLRSPAGSHAEVALDRLVRPRALAERLAVFARSYPGEDLRGLASLWLQWYLVTAWPPVMTAVLLLGRDLDLDPARSALVLDAAGKPEAIALQAAGRAGDPHARLEAFVHGHAAPLLDGMSRAACMAPRVAWSNAANVLGWFLVEAETVADPARLAPGWRLMREPRRRDGAPNPLCIADFDNGPPAARPARRVCCLRFLLTQHPYCTDCPIPAHRRS